MLDDNDLRITPKLITNEIPSEFLLPFKAINGELYYVLAPTVAYQGLQNFNIGGQFIEEVLENDAPAPAEPTQQRGKRHGDEAQPYLLASKSLLLLGL
jgi:hypothetical protein